MRMLCILPATLLSMLFYLDQNITIRTTEAALSSKKNKKGGGGFLHQDMMALSLITGILSIFGLPWTCAATVQSLNHVRACKLSPNGGDDNNTNNGNEETSSTKATDDSTEIVVVEKSRDIMESRMTGFAIHSLILGSLVALPVLSYIPIPVISGIFLYLGRKIMKGNLFLDRVGHLFVQPELLPQDSVFRTLKKDVVAKYLSAQGVMLSLIWYLKQNKKYSIFFPSCIGLLAMIRAKILPKFFTEEELVALDPDM